MKHLRLPHLLFLLVSVLLAGPAFGQTVTRPFKGR
jgi:hypothetical protein